MVVANGIKAALLPVLKNGDASTLDVVSRVLKTLPKIAATLPEDLRSPRSLTNRFLLAPRFLKCFGREPSREG